MKPGGEDFRDREKDEQAETDIKTFVGPLTGNEGERRHGWKDFSRELCVTVNSTGLTRNLGLTEEFEAGASENGNRAIVVVHVDSERRLTARPHEQGVGEMNVHLAHK